MMLMTSWRVKNRHLSQNLPFRMKRMIMIKIRKQLQTFRFKRWMVAILCRSYCQLKSIISLTKRSRARICTSMTITVASLGSPYPCNQRYQQWIIKVRRPSCNHIHHKLLQQSSKLLLGCRRHQPHAIINRLQVRIMLKKSQRQPQITSLHLNLWTSQRIWLGWCFLRKLTKTWLWSNPLTKFALIRICSFACSGRSTYCNMVKKKLIKSLNRPFHHRKVLSILMIKATRCSLCWRAAHRHRSQKNILTATQKTF